MESAKFEIIGIKQTTNPSFDSSASQLEEFSCQLSRQVSAALNLPQLWQCQKWLTPSITVMGNTLSSLGLKFFYTIYKFNRDSSQNYRVMV